MFHPLRPESIEGVELPEFFTNPFDYEPHPLVAAAREEFCAYLQQQHQWHAEIEQGKMFGLLIVQKEDGSLGFLAAFSGYLSKQTRHPYFVSPILDLLTPGGFFAVEEANISQINSDISAIDATAQVQECREQLERIAREESVAIEPLRLEYRTARARRTELRAAGAPPEQLNAESQRQKGVIRRCELHYRTLREPIEKRQQQLLEQRSLLVEERQKRSAALQQLTFSRFEPLNALGAKRDLITIFREYNNSVPPAGSGECAAPKLLHYAFTHRLRPVAMGEFWWGRSTRGEVRRHLSYYPACRGKCHPILSFMLQGLTVEPPRPRSCEEQLLEQLSVIFEDQHIVVFNKPSGLPSVRGTNHTLSVQSIVEERYSDLNPNNFIVHRLDMDTSGVLIIAKSAQVQAALQQQFSQHTIRKRYIALLEGIPQQPKGAIDLPLILDPLDRPRQRVDHKNGKAAYTHYTVLSCEQGKARVALYPQTGRTHQLRVHCAHCEGLALPIIGDRLYGAPSSRLMLHAEQITFRHPATGRKLTLSCDPSF